MVLSTKVLDEETGGKKSHGNNKGKKIVASPA